MNASTGQAFPALPPILPDPWVVDSFDEHQMDFVCKDTFIGGPDVYAKDIPHTPVGWGATFDKERQQFMFYEKKQKKT